MYIDQTIKTKYFDSASKMVKNERWIYVEGSTNKAFYQKFNEISHIPMMSGGSCGLIINKVRENINASGIIDNDYRNEIQYDRIFNIDYYSIENIQLIFHPLMIELKEELFNKFIQDFEISVNKCLDLIINRDNEKRVRSYQLIFSNDEENQYLEYLSCRLTNNIDFVRYKRLKNVIVKYFDFLRQFRGRMSVPENILLDTYNYLPTKTISDIFKSNTIKKINEYLKMS